MSGSQSYAPSALVLKGLFASLFFLSFASRDSCADEKSPEIVETVPSWSFAAEITHYRRLAMKHQPRLHAYRASVTAAHAKAQALDALRAPKFVRPDLPHRRQQARKGIEVAAARARAAEWDTVYSVTRMYLSAIYGRSQAKLLDQFLNDDTLGLESRKKFILTALRQKQNPDAPPQRSDLNRWDYFWDAALIEAVRGEEARAKSGKARALVALREAVGLSWKIQLSLDDEAHFPSINPQVDRRSIIQSALKRRGEIHQASLGVALTELEISAQYSSRRSSLATFASGGDLHSESIPQGNKGTDYSPSAVGLEMPTLLAGRRDARVEQANALHHRAKAVLAKTQQLIALEAENAYLLWKERKKIYEKKEAARKEAYKAVLLAYQEFQKHAVPGKGDPLAEGKTPPPSFQQLIELQQRHTYLRGQRNEALYLLMLSLAQLEYVTAGGFCAGFESAPQTEAPDDLKTIQKDIKATLAEIQKLEQTKEKKKQ